MSTQDFQDGYLGVVAGYQVDQVDELADLIQKHGLSRWQKLHAAKVFVLDCKTFGWSFAWGWFGAYLTAPKNQLSLNL